MGVYRDYGYQDPKHQRLITMFNSGSVKTEGAYYNEVNVML